MSGIETDEAVAARRLGELIGRYRLERVLGAGGMAVVYAGRTPEGETAAIKVLFADMSARRDVRERFYREGYVGNSIRHPAVVRVLEHGETRDGIAYLAMELLQGETLAQRAERLGSLSTQELLEIADQVLDALSAAHQLGIVHRDLKPDNLFVTDDGQIKILDFGLARLLDTLPQDRRTRSGVALGTLPYMAPEQALGRRAEVDARVDLFALGATLFRLHTGRRIHEADSDAELLMYMASKPAPPLASVLPSVATGFAQIVDLALAFSRDARYPDARTMQADVRAVQASKLPPYANQKLHWREQKTYDGPATEGPPSPTVDLASTQLPPFSDVADPRLIVGKTVPIPIPPRQPQTQDDFGQTFRSTYAPPGLTPIGPQRAPVVVEIVQPAKAVEPPLDRTFRSALARDSSANRDAPAASPVAARASAPPAVWSAEAAVGSAGTNGRRSAPAVSSAATSRVIAPPIWALLVLAGMAVSVFAGLAALAWWVLMWAGKQPAAGSEPTDPSSRPRTEQSISGGAAALDSHGNGAGPSIVPIDPSASSSASSSSRPAPMSPGHAGTAHVNPAHPRHGALSNSAGAAPSSGSPAPAPPNEAPDSERVLDDRGPILKRPRRSP